MLRGSRRRCRPGDRARPCGDHRCGTAPGSHRTSLVLHHPGQHRGKRRVRRQQLSRQAFMTRQICSYQSGFYLCHCCRVHLVPKDRRSQRVLDDERACQAISGIGESENVDSWARRFALLGDPRRLALLLGIHHAGPISVTDLAVAANQRATSVSQALRLLRANGTVTAHRDGRVVRYTLADDDLVEVFERVTPRAVSVARFKTAHQN